MEVVDPTKRLMKCKKAELCTMLSLAMEEKNRWEAEFFHLEKEYEELLKWKNEIKDRLIASENKLNKIKVEK